MSGYAVVHLVAQESFKGLIGPQVVDHMAHHASTHSVTGPERVVIGLLEPARVALRGRFRARIAELRARAPRVRVLALPYVSRFGVQRNAWAIARRLQWATGSLRVVFHCRGESAAEWAIALRRFFPRSAIVVDVRGPWPDELLFARGYDGPDSADARSLSDYHGALDRLRGVCAATEEVFSVSQGMLKWLREVGVPDERLTYVPCCAERVEYDEGRREAARARLGLTDKLVLAYLGIVTRYQHVEGGVIPFFAKTLAHLHNAHLLVITPDADTVHRTLAASAIPAAAATVLTLPQREVGDTLRAADAGFLLRSPSRLTRVVQPVKLGEYLSVGVPVIVSRGAGRIDEMIENARAGVVTSFGLQSVHGDDAEVRRVLDIIAADGPALRASAARLCARELVWAAYAADVHAAYARALGAVEQRDSQEKYA